MNKQRDPGDFYPGGAVQVDSVQELAKGDKGDDAMTQATKDAINALSEIDPEAADFGPRKLAQGVNDVLGALKQMAAPLIVAVLTAATVCAQDGVYVHSVRFADLLNGPVVTGVVVRGVATTGYVAQAAMAVQAELGTIDVPEYYVSGGETYNYFDSVSNGIYFNHRYRYSYSSGGEDHEYFISCDFYNRTVTVHDFPVAFTNAFDLIYPLDGYPVGTPYGTTSVVDRVFTMARLSDITAHSENTAAHADIRAVLSNKVDAADAVTYRSLQSVSAAGVATVNLSGSRPTLVTLTSNATLGVTGLYPYYPAYLMVQGDYSWGFSNATYWVGGAWYQTNRANHYVVWTVGTNLYVNPVTTSEVLP